MISSVLIAIAAVIVSTAIYKRFFKYIRIWYCLRKRKSSTIPRLCYFPKLQDIHAPLEDIGLLPKAQDYVLEKPNARREPGRTDGIHFFGVDSDGSYLDLKLNVLENNVASTWVILNIKDVGLFRAPFDKDTTISCIENSETFSCGGIQVRCYTPLRRWRISFNGLLRKCSETGEAGNSEDDIKHVKFSFIWVASSLAYDFKHEYVTSELAKSIMKTTGHVDSDLLARLEDISDSYEQWGQLMGTVQIGDSEEKELYLWSARTRILEKPCLDCITEYANCYIYFREGIPMHIQLLSIEGITTNFLNGYMITHGGVKDQLFQCNLQLEAIQDDIPEEMSICFTKSTENKEYTMTISRVEPKICFLVGSSLKTKLVLQPIKVRIKDEEGYGIIHYGITSHQNSLNQHMTLPLILKDEGLLQVTDKFVLPLSDKHCQSSHTAGGKGCSLALLTTLSQQSKKFVVPKGFVVTTSAFNHHIAGNLNLKTALEKLKNAASQNLANELEKECMSCCHEFSTTPTSNGLKCEISSQLMTQFENPEDTKFAIRSSAFGEDSEDMSAAGQMTTVLGVKGLSNIYEAILECWASHFRFEAVQYQRQYGQPIDTPMAIVVQEMVPAEAAGILFTVDPVTGNPLYPCITANFGLGESVVSSQTEPDTFTLKRNSDMKMTSIVNRTIGTKLMSTVLNAEGGVEQKLLNTPSEEFCLNDECIKKIGDVGLLVEDCFCSSRDIEWAVYRNELYLLQARPITTLHKETEFELIHDQDSATKSDEDYWTRANTGEVFRSATSPLGISLAVQSMDTYGHRTFVTSHRGKNFTFVPYCLHWLPITNRYVFLSLIDTLYRTNQKKVTRVQKAMEVSLFGRILDLPELHHVGLKRHETIGFLKEYVGYAFLTLLMFLIPQKIKKYSKKVDDLIVPIEDFRTSADAYKGICNLIPFYGEVCGIHGLATYLSSIFNVLVLSILSLKRDKWDNVLYSDFAILLSSCTNVESADVPSSMQKVAEVIAEDDYENFTSASVEEAYSWLSTNKGAAGAQFQEFLQKHGHRCVQEFDVYALSWELNPFGLIETLQKTVQSAGGHKLNPKEVVDVADALKLLQTPLSNTMKLFLKKGLPLCRKAVGQRERTKSMIIKIINWLRKCCYHLGSLMVKEGYLPDKELLFFLNLDEINVLMQTRSPTLVSRATNRKRVHAKLANIQFPEIMKGIPRPYVTDDDEILRNGTDYIEIKGTPVCKGRVTARVTVASQLADAKNIKPGDILVTHSTDIGWSPYFPLLAGVITELGGLISHGAVVAREYGLPCVVGVQRATHLLKTGDHIILDGNKGIITKTNEVPENNA